MVTTEGNIEKVHYMILDEWRLKLYEIVKVVGISENTIRIVHFTRRIKYETVLKRKQSIWCADLFLWMKRGFTTLRLKQNKSLSGGWKPVALHQKSVTSAGKIKVSVCWNVKTILLIDHLQTDKTKTPAIWKKPRKQTCIAQENNHLPYL